MQNDGPIQLQDPGLQKAFDAAFLQAKIDAVRFNTGLIVQRDGKLTHIQPKELIPDLEAAGLEVVIVRPKKPSGEAVWQQNKPKEGLKHKKSDTPAMAALYANGYRTLTNRPGHHQTAIQGLVHSIGLANKRVWTIDALRKQRNLNDYSGELVPESAVNACIEQTLMLQVAVTDWIRTNKPDLL